MDRTDPSPGLPATLSGGADEAPRVDERYEGLDISGGSWRGLCFESCTFVSCDFTGAELKECEFLECHFETCNLSSATVADTRIDGSAFVGCKLTAIDWTSLEWPAVRFYDTHEFRQCKLLGAFFAGLPLRDTSFVDCDLTEADFSDCDLSAVGFRGSNLDGARFERANLTDTSFVGALGYRLDVRTTRFAGTKFALPEALRLFDSLPIVIEELDPSPPVPE